MLDTTKIKPILMISFLSAQGYALIDYSKAVASLEIELLTAEHVELLGFICACAAAQGLIFGFLTSLFPLKDEAIVWGGLLAGLSPFVIISSTIALGLDSFNTIFLSTACAGVVLLMLYPPAPKIRMGIILLFCQLGN